MRTAAVAVAAAATMFVINVGVSAAARAQTGVCDSNPPTTTDACINAIQSGGTVVNDIFRDKNGRSGPELPVFGSIFNQWPGCATTDFAGCSGHSQPPFDCPGQYVCEGAANTVENAQLYAGALDRLWWHPCRLADHTLDANGCPAFGTCTTDGTGGSYFPWEGLVFDLGGQANQVAIFAENDHGPQPCESTEYTVFLSDDPFARDEVLNPAVDGVDPTKWNRAVLSSIYTKGWADIRAPDPVGHGTTCGDTADYAVEEDSFVTVYALPCGVTFRYAAIVAGNDGLDFAECAFDSQEAELDAVAGLSEDGTAVCPDADLDGFPDCNCIGAPASCDCNDADPSIHPGAVEACDSVVDADCSGAAGFVCDDGTTCHAGRCLSACEVGEVVFCPGGATCESTTDGLLCVPADCTSTGCPDGAVCTLGQCLPTCEGVACPFGEVCRDGACIDACANVACTGTQVCVDGACKPPCTCLAGDLGCANGDVCNTDGSCSVAACSNVSCDVNTHCVDDGTGTGVCVGLCDAVTCPFGEECDDVAGCVSRCASVTCDAGLTCDPGTGTCIVATGEGEGAAAGEGEGAANDGEGAAGDGEGAANDGEGEGAGSGGGVDGCGCRASDTSSSTIVFAMVAGVWAWRRRRR